MSPKSPVIPQMRNLQDVIRALNNIRAYYSAKDAEGKQVTVVVPNASPAPPQPQPTPPPPPSGELGSETNPIVLSRAIGNTGDYYGYEIQVDGVGYTIPKRMTVWFEIDPSIVKTPIPSSISFWLTVYDPYQVNVSAVVYSKNKTTGSKTTLMSLNPTSESQFYIPGLACGSGMDFIVSVTESGLKDQALSIKWR